MEAVKIESMAATPDTRKLYQQVATTIMATC
jgi:hypothetical protein